MGMEVTCKALGGQSMDSTAVETLDFLLRNLDFL